jgi:hypothetical protein
MATEITGPTIHRVIRDHFERQQRLANQAEQAGVRIVTLYKTEKHLAIDPHYPQAYAVNAERCSCRDFALWGACGHHALLLSELGQLPDPATEIGWPGQGKTILPEWERRSTGAASGVALKLVGA